MKEHHISIVELAATTGIPKANISRLINHQNSNPTLSSIFPIAKYFKISVSELIGDPIYQANDTKNVSRQIKNNIKSQFKEYIDNFEFEES